MEVPGFWPVSYTHLDVYKRQILEKARTASVTTLNDTLDKVLPNVATNLDTKEMLSVLKDLASYKAVSYTHLDVYKRQEYVPFTGNMSGMLIAEYILRERTATGTMPANPAMVKTIVTTNMADPIAADYHVKLIEVLTGFKYIGEQIKLFEETESNNYVFGLEESYGCLAGTHARDKDAVVAVMCLCEVCLLYTSFCCSHKY